MPRRPRTPCQHPGCARLVPAPGRCPKHRTVYDREIKTSSPWRDYGSEWRNEIRPAVLERDPKCRCPGGHRRCCGGKAASAEAHHIVPRRDGGTDDLENLLGYCKSCHSAETQREIAARR